MNSSRNKKNIWKEIKKPVLVLAPMAGYTDSAFRLICRGQGADLVMTELISADAIAFGKFEIEDSRFKVVVRSNRNKSTAELLSFYRAERPLAVQLFGKNPDNFGRASLWISQNLPVDGIDINMGCPTKKVIGSDHGAALLKNPKLAIEIVRMVKSNTSLPVSVKTRLGWQDDDEILEFAPLLAQAGIDAIIIHGRTYKDGFSGAAKWQNIYKVKEILGDKTVVIGNGDVGNGQNTGYRIQKLIENLDGVAIGRASFGNPSIFRDNIQFTNFQFSIEWKNSVLRHAGLVYEMKGDHGIIEFRKHMLAYLKGFYGAKELRKKAVQIETLADIDKILNELSQQKVK